MQHVHVLECSVYLCIHRVSECRFFDSKMRPLLLVYDNPDQSAVLQDVMIMFKNGDGELRDGL